MSTTADDVKRRDIVCSAAREFKRMLAHASLFKLKKQ
jgi:hypothetical protein